MSITKRIITAIIVASALTACCPSKSKVPAEAREILKNIKVPEFRQVDYPASDFGAVAEDSIPQHSKTSD